MDCRDVGVSGEDLLDGLHVLALRERGGFALDEEADVLGADLDVELQSHDIVLADEGLMAAGIGAGKEGGAGWEIEGVSVPMEGGELSGKMGEERVLADGIEGADGKPADLELRVLVDFAAHDIGDELGAEANPQDRLSLTDDLRDEGFLGDQPGVVAMLVDMHPAAHDDQEIDCGGIGGGVAAIPVGAGELVAFVRGPVCDLAGALAGGVLQEVDVHGEEFKGIFEIRNSKFELRMDAEPQWKGEF